jgi:glycine/serine hydroxymethyltransferase
MTRVAQLIDDVLTHKDDGTVARVKQDVRELTDAFPLYATHRPVLRTAR